MIEYAFFPQQKAVVARMTEDVDFEELLEWHYTVFSWSDYEPTFSGLVDMRNAKLSIDHDDIKRLVLINKDIALLRGRWACLVREPAIDDLSRVYRSVKLNLFEIEFFLTTGAASDYIGMNVIATLADFDQRTDRLHFSLKPRHRYA